MSGVIFGPALAYTNGAVPALVLFGLAIRCWPKKPKDTA